MGIPAQFCLGDFGTPPQGDQATGVISGQFTAVGLSSSFAFYGCANFSLVCSTTDVLTTTRGSFSATISGPTSGILAPGTSIQYGSFFPNGAVLSTYAAGTGTIAFPPYFITAKLIAGFDYIEGNFPTDGYVIGTNIIGSTIVGTGIASSTTVTGIIQDSNQLFGHNGNFPPPNKAIISLSNPVIGSSIKPYLTNLTLFPSANLIPTSSSNAFFTGSTIAYTGSVQLEKSFDGGATWLIANIGPPGSGALAIFQNASSVSFSLFEPEKGVLYRWNCTSFTPGGGGAQYFINYRISETGTLNQSSSPR